MKKRLDILAGERLNISRAKAQALIMAGAIFVDEKPVVKSGTEIEESAVIMAKEIFPYVSRGALKLQKAAEEFGIDFRRKFVCDIGASTGGFTDFALQNGAAKVYAIDTGKGQIAQKLRDNTRVVLMENTNIRKVESLPEPIDIFVIDVSFISLKKVLPQVITIIENCKLKIVNCSVVALIKPQFEVGKEIADKTKGIIKDKEIQEKVVSDIVSFSKDLGFIVKGVTDSPITGAKGNKEFLLYLQLKIAVGSEPVEE